MCRIKSVLLSLLTAVVVAGCAASAGTRQDAAVEANRGLIGAWIVTASRPAGVGKNLLTFSSDGTFFRSGDTHPVLSGAHGAWKRVGEDAGTLSLARTGQTAIDSRVLIVACRDKPVLNWTALELFELPAKNILVKRADRFRIGSVNFEMNYALHIQSFLKICFAQFLNAVQATSRHDQSMLPRTRDKDFPTKYIFRWLPLGWPFFHTCLGPKAPSQPGRGQRSREEFDGVSHCAVVIPIAIEGPHLRSWITQGICTIIAHSRDPSPRKHSG